jgi:uncharacterized protein
LEWILPGGIFFLSSFFHGITGFGFIILALPLLVLFIQPHDAVIICTILGTINALILLFRTWRGILFPTVRNILLFSLLGLPGGLYVFVNSDLRQLNALISFLVVALGLVLLPKWSIKFRNVKIAEPCVGFLTGLFQGSVGMTGIPPAVYITIQGIQKAGFRASINAILLILGTIGLILFRNFSDVPGMVYWKGLLFVPVIVAGQSFGVAVSGRVSQELFRKMVIYTIIGSGLYGLAQLGLKPGN